MCKGATSAQGIVYDRMEDERADQSKMGSKTPFVKIPSYAAYAGHKDHAAECKDGTVVAPQQCAGTNQIKCVDVTIRVCIQGAQITASVQASFGLIWDTDRCGVQEWNRRRPSAVRRSRDQCVNVQRRCIARDDPSTSLNRQIDCQGERPAS